MNTLFINTHRDQFSRQCKLSYDQLLASLNEWLPKRGIDFDSLASFITLQPDAWKEFLIFANSNPSANKFETSFISGLDFASCLVRDGLSAKDIYEKVRGNHFSLDFINSYHKAFFHSSLEDVSLRVNSSLRIVD